MPEIEVVKALNQALWSAGKPRVKGPLSHFVQNSPCLEMALTSHAANCR